MTESVTARRHPRLRLVAQNGATRLVSSTPDDRDGRLLLWWLGQAGFAIRYREELVVLDPYLSDSLREKHANGPYGYDRLVPVPVQPDKLTECTWLLCTHAHTDHMDPPTIRAIARAADPRILVPSAEASTALARGVSLRALRTIDADAQLDLADDVRVEAIASAHETIETDIDGRHRFLGYVISAGGVRIYHSGDCVPYVGLGERLAPLGVDFALLPVNGRDEQRLRRGVPGNFTPREAAHLCRKAGIPQLVAHHIGMFAFNTAEPVALRSMLDRNQAGVHAQVLLIGAAYEIEIRRGAP